MVEINDAATDEVTWISTDQRGSVGDRINASDKVLQHLNHDGSGNLAFRLTSADFETSEFSLQFTARRYDEGTEL